jgi:hypothetical protein
MKKLFVIALLLILSVPSFAGAYISPASEIDNPQYTFEVIDDYPPYIGPAPVISQTCNLPKVTYAKGLAIGIENSMPLLAYEGTDAGVAIGASSINSSTQLLVKGTGNIWASKDKSQVAKVGLAISNVSAYGVFVEFEQFLSANTSITGDLYPYVWGNGNNIFGLTSMGMKIYL